jgi:CheY-like chemotaxis protein
MSDDGDLRRVTRERDLAVAGRGTTCRVYLPERDRDETPAPHAEARETSRGDEAILVVDDDDGVRRTVASLLESRGYRVLAADSGAAALATWETADGQIDLLVTDVMMPGMNGPEVAAALSARRPGIPILMISGHSRDLDPSIAVSYELLHKPFDAEILLAAVRACLDRAPNRE